MLPTQFSQETAIQTLRSWFIDISDEFSPIGFTEVPRGFKH